jgi:hypothetical protein
MPREKDPHSRKMEWIFVNTALTVWQVFDKYFIIIGIDLRTPPSRFEVIQKREEKTILKGTHKKMNHASGTAIRGESIPVKIISAQVAYELHPFIFRKAGYAYWEDLDNGHAG